MQDVSRDVRSNDFLTGLTQQIVSHTRKRRWDSFLYEFLVIGAAIAGFASLTFGLLATKDNNYAVWAGAVGALTSVATVLSQQLHCVKAINWHERMAVQLDVIRAKFLYQYKSAPGDVELAAMSEEVSTIKLEMLRAWEKVTSSGPTALGEIKMLKRHMAKSTQT